MIRVRELGVAAALLGQNIREAKAELDGKALSRARRIKPLSEIQALRPGKPVPTAILMRMKDGDPMRYFSDGSLRHATGFKPGKAARKALKRQRRKEA